MTSMKIRFLMIVTLLSTITALPMVAHGAIVSNPGSISGDGVIGGGNWGTGVSLGWSVADTGSAYLYSYTFDAPTPALNHFYLQTSGNFTEANILGTPTDYTLGTFTAGPSNPGWPEGESLYGIQFEGFTGYSSKAFTLLSDRAPMEGDFYATGEKESFAYNSGFGTLDGVNILVPDTASIPVPEAGTLLLLGSGLMSIAVWGRRRKRMQG